MPDMGGSPAVGKRYYSFFCGLWAIVILVLSLTPGRELPEVNIWEADKFIHIGVYLLLAWLLCMSIQQHSGKTRYSIGGLALLVAALFGIAIEVIQGTWIAERYFDVLDILANIIGSFTGITIYWLLTNRVN